HWTKYGIQKYLGVNRGIFSQRNETGFVFTGLKFYRSMNGELLAFALSTNSLSGDGATWEKSIRDGATWEKSIRDGATWDRSSGDGATLNFSNGDGAVLAPKLLANFLAIDGAVLVAKLLCKSLFLIISYLLFIRL
ncbi:MAG TPA: hypothetical protein VK364_07410, partial [Hymenobacter sp.]|nr:hypothetical protein [Hymenobacter sp.]